MFIYMHSADKVQTNRGRAVISVDVHVTERQPTFIPLPHSRTFLCYRTQSSERFTRIVTAQVEDSEAPPLFVFHGDCGF
jgi:hypothetical protein